MNALSTIAGLLTVLVHLPIWYYLIYKILDMVGASELMWFLFWIYIPVGLFTTAAAKLVNKK